MQAKPKQQLPLPTAPVLDWSGLHARECECSRCQCGYAPTENDRKAAVDAARKVHLDKAIQAAALSQMVTREAKALKRRERAIRAEIAAEEAVQENARSRLAASDAPPGGFREFMKGGGQ